MRFDQAPLGGASNDLPTDDPVFILEQIAEQADRMVERRDYPNLRDFPATHSDIVELSKLIASLARALSRKGVA